MLLEIQRSYEQSAWDTRLFMKRVQRSGITIPADIQELLEERIETAIAVSESSQNEILRRRSHQLW
ncbi:hypothetical protein GTO89_13535 [Heliobacterium gestii]|uniref:Uncharacterized protein n=1 Tax=Heliomicrobium gestii TaxID=2699 RepID=A0A845LI14_HELGE|nr:hypothetical protein [Heliomicrobium gestii]MBM7867662.1 hypothetical protein [Heliomicrobium gestii]MZP44055.1 hypothetical protein [Heliomicrobium gestii]